MSEEKRKRGRPKKEGSRNVQLKIMVTMDEYEELLNASKLVDKSMSEITRNGMHMSINNEIYMYNLNKESDDDNDDYEDPYNWE